MTCMYMYTMFSNFPFIEFMGQPKHFDTLLLERLLCMRFGDQLKRTVQGISNLGLMR